MKDRNIEKRKRTKYLLTVPPFLRPNTMDVEKIDSSSTMHLFKARPLNKKVILKPCTDYILQKLHL